jgi:hypothetical protein
MTSTTRPTASFKRIVIVFAVIMAMAAGGTTPALHAQSAQALEAQHRRLLPLFELGPVVFTDADEANGRLVVGVRDRGAEGLVRAQLARLGLTSESVDVVETEAIERVVSLRDRVRPVTAGLQIRFDQFVCSLGFSAARGGVAGFVTAAHCSSTQGDADNTQYYQPLNQVPDEFIGMEVADPAFFRNTNGCPRGRKCRYSDSNFSAGAIGVPFTLGGIARTSGPNNGSLDIVGGFAISGEGSASVGETANKIGRTSGWTNGIVTRTCVNTGVSGSNIVLLCQGFVENSVPIVQGGDSGSPVFGIESNGRARLLGNLWGGSSSGRTFVYSPIANIKLELGALTTF